MDRIRVVGGRPLKGEITISGAKNATLPLMAASLLTDEPFIIENVPALADVNSMCELLTQHGVHISRALGTNTITFNASGVDNTVAPYEIVRKMRASILVLGPLLARYGKATVSLPGGCVIGTRPVDVHLDGLRELGADIFIENGYIEARAPKGLKGAKIIMSVISVTGTENLMMAAALAKGQTVLKNAAREPEIVDLAECLTKMGVMIEGAGTDTITIEGKDSLKGTTHRVIPDRIETGTYIMASAIMNSPLILRNTSIDLIPSETDILKKAGVLLNPLEDGIHVEISASGIQGIDITTEPFPGFSTDLQAQMMALMTVAEGASLVTEKIFENRFMHVSELCRLGANITVKSPSSAHVRGVQSLLGAEVMATDIRASVCLVLAGLAAQGETIINRVYHLDRGYDNLVGKLTQCGAEIERISG